MSDTRSADRWAVLGLMRWLLAALVVNEHLVKASASWQTVLDRCPFRGLAAVFGFFLISGYSIAASMEREPQHFYRRRVERLVPAYYAGFALCLLPLLTATGARIAAGGLTVNWPSPLSLLATALCLQGFIAPVATVMPQYWSLSCEAAYYAMAPLLARFESVAWGLLAVSATIDVRAVVMHWPGHVYASFGASALRCAWLWLAGWLYHGRRERRYAGAWFVGVVGLLIWLACRHQEDRLVGSRPTLLVVAVALAIVLAPRLPMSRRLARLLKYLGDLSYPLYAVHVPLLIWLGLYRTVPPLVSVVVVLAAAVAVHHGVERPLHRRWNARRKPPEAMPR
jgi:peptidoglycan/LPS O-acetylase OafA/YrhL